MLVLFTWDIVRETVIVGMRMLGIQTEMMTGRTDSVVASSLKTGYFNFPGYANQSSFSYILNVLLLYPDCLFLPSCLPGVDC